MGRTTSQFGCLDKFAAAMRFFVGIRQSASLEELMNTQFLKFRTNYLLGLITAFSLGISAPALWAQQDKDPLKAWATIQQTVKDMETAKAKKLSSALQQLDSAVTDLHSAADEGSQAKSETALKSVEGALDQLKAEEPEAAFENMH